MSISRALSLILFAVSSLWIAELRIAHAFVQDTGLQPGETRSVTRLSEARVMTGDLSAIKQTGRLRILVPANIGGGQYLPRKGSPVSQQQEIAEAFARFHDLVPELIIVDNFKDIIAALEEGKGDIAVANLTITPQRRKTIDFSVPIHHVYEKVLVRKSNDAIKAVRDLDGKKVMVSRASTFWESLKWLKDNKYKDIDLIPRPDGMTDDEEMDLLAAGKIDATIRDSNIVDMYSTYRDDFKVAVNFSKQRNIAWGLRKNAPALANALNRFLLLEYQLEDSNALHFDDLDAIKQRKVLRVLLRNNASSYFLYKGELMGFEYEMVRKFAREQGLRLEVIVPPGHKELLSWLIEGRADLAMGFLNPTEKRKALGIEFTEPYSHEAEHVVVHEDSKLDSLDAMQQRTFTVRSTSAYWDTLQELKSQGYPVVLDAAPDDMETEELIGAVGNKTISTTLADAHFLDIELARGTPVKSAFAIGEDKPKAVATRQNNPQLRAAINAFIKKNLKSEYYNVLYHKYFNSRKSIKKLASGRIEDINKNRLSPYDKITRKYADKYGFDWRLVTAQMYQESRFDPKAKSFAGARGLMQLMPRTAESVGVSNIEKPESNIEGGVRYLNWLRNRFDDELPTSEKNWFVLAAYNAGVGHVRDAQRLARKKGWDANRWFNHTEKAMLLLARDTYASKARYGYVDGEEPVNYVRNIRTRFKAYTRLEHEEVTQLTPP